MSGGPASDTLAVDTRTALRRLAQSVSVITCRHDGVRTAMAATAVNALSLDPPALLACVNRTSSMHDTLSTVARYAINILGRDHEPLSRRCGGGAQGEARFDGCDWEDVDGVPVLLDAQATIICARDTVLAYGSHSIFIGRVVAVRTFGPVDPLLYVDGRYVGVNRMDALNQGSGI